MHTTWALPLIGLMGFKIEIFSPPQILYRPGGITGGSQDVSREIAILSLK